MLLPFGRCGGIAGGQLPHAIEEPSRERIELPSKRFERGLVSDRERAHNDIHA